MRTANGGSPRERRRLVASTVEVLLGVAAEPGHRVSAPRFVAPETFDRLIAPVFLEALPAHVRKTGARLLEFFATYLPVEERDAERPAAPGQLGCMELPDQRESLANNLHFWAD